MPELSGSLSTFTLVASVTPPERVKSPQANAYQRAQGSTLDAERCDVVQCPAAVLVRAENPPRQRDTSAERKADNDGRRPAAQ